MTETTWNLQMSCGMSMEEAARYRLPKEPLKVFRYLNSSGCTAIEGVDDKADFQEVRQAMLAVNIDEESQVRLHKDPLGSEKMVLKEDPLSCSSVSSQNWSC
jgi:hypothetical protein